jgi:hypothetical protein
MKSNKKVRLSIILLTYSSHIHVYPYLDDAADKWKQINNNVLNTVLFPDDQVIRAKNEENLKRATHTS